MSSKVKEIVETILEIEFDDSQNPSTESTEEWDSIKHLQLMSTIEDEFGIKLTDEDLMSLTSYESIKNKVEGN